ncbi:MAG: hypothetical protein WAO76_13640 [Georgfuchsia sp.]
MLEFISRIFGKDVVTIETLAESIAEVSMICGQTFVSNMAKDDNGNVTSTSVSVAFATNEYLYFLLHYVNRLAFAIGGIASQNKICDEVFGYAAAKLTMSLPEKSRSDCLSMLLEGMNEAEREYSKCKRLTPEGDEGAKGTLFWEASKRISASAGGGMDIRNIIVATEAISAALSSLKLEGKIKKLVKGHV